MTKLIAFILLFPCIAYSQDSTIIRSKFETFSSRTGTMFKTETKEVGKVRDISVAKVRTSDLHTGEAVEAIRIYQLKSALLSVISVGVLYIDVDEIEGAVRALQVYLKAIANGRPLYEPTYNYVTKNDVVVTCSYSDAAFMSGWAVTFSQRYHYLKTTIPNTMIILKNKDIENMAALIQKAADEKF